MPYINIRLNTKLDSNQKSQLSIKTTDLMNTIMGKRREVTVVHIQEDAPEQWAINSLTLNSENPTAAYVDIKVTQNTNTPVEKAAMLAQTIMMLQEVVGALQEACYVVITDVPANSWGYNGKTQAARAASKLL
ncbi:MAG: tautomerase family protein [Oceanospirillaceae bacterium]|nr:tautomerase family protein [Oceanospirillaceae bacterium]